MNELTRTLGEWFKKAPHLPEKFRELIVKVAPWISIVVLVLALPALLAFLGIAGFSTVSLGAYGAILGGNAMLGLIFALVAVVLQALAIPGLFARRESGWRYSYYGVLWSVLENLLRTDVLGAVIGGAIGLYILFEIKHLYR